MSIVVDTFRGAWLERFGAGFVAWADRLADRLDAGMDAHLDGLPASGPLEAHAAGGVEELLQGAGAAVDDSSLNFGPAVGPSGLAQLADGLGFEAGDLLLGHAAPLRPAADAGIGGLQGEEHRDVDPILSVVPHVPGLREWSEGRGIGRIAE